MQFLDCYGYIAPIEGRRKAEEAARKALALDENLAEAHAALGHAYIASPRPISRWVIVNCGGRSNSARA